MNRRQILARSGVGLGVVTLAGCLDTLSGDSEDVEVADRTAETLNEEVRHVALSGGKRVRPMVTVLACETVGGTAEEAVDFGVGIELVHNASLVIDDIIDRSELRRGTASAWAEFGYGPAIITSDGLLGEAFGLFSTNPQATRTVAEAMVELGIGEATELSAQPSNEEEYMTLARRKTAEHAKNEMDAEATLPAPVYAPETVAQTILDAAEHPEREITVGGGGKGMILLDRIAPGLLDTLMERVFYNQQRTDEEPTAEHSLESPSEDLETRGGYEGHVADSSLYTRLRQRRGLTGTALAGLAATAAYAGYRALRGRRDDPPRNSGAKRCKRLRTQRLFTRRNHDALSITLSCGHSHGTCVLLCEYRRISRRDERCR